MENIADLSDADLDALLDRHAFNEEPWCAGYSSICGCCVVCGASEDWPAYRGTSRHPRRVPMYHIEQIIEAMAARSHRAVFARLVLAAIGGARQGEAILGLSRRIVAIAALQALGIIDAQGYVVRQGELRSEAILV